MIGHDMEQTGLRTNLLVLVVRRRRARVGGLRGERRLVRSSHELRDARPIRTGITFDEFDVVNPYNFQPGVLADITTAPFLPDNSVGREPVGRVRRSAIQSRATALPSSARCAWTTTTRRSCALGRAGIDQQVDDVTGRIGLVFDLSDDTALYGQYGTGSQPSERLGRDRVRQQSSCGHDRERAARDRPQAPGRRDGLRSGTSRCSISRRTT